MSVPPKPMRLSRNLISEAGIGIAVVALANLGFLIYLDATRENSNPYMGILTWIVAPAILICGMLLFICGRSARAAASGAAMLRMTFRNIRASISTRGARASSSFPPPSVSFCSSPCPWSEAIRPITTPIRMPSAGRPATRSCIPSTRRISCRRTRTSAAPAVISARSRMVRPLQALRFLSGVRRPHQQIPAPHPEPRREPAAGPGDVRAMPLAGEILRRAIEGLRPLRLRRDEYAERGADAHQDRRRQSRGPARPAASTGT